VDGLLAAIPAVAHESGVRGAAASAGSLLLVAAIAASSATTAPTATAAAKSATSTEAAATSAATESWGATTSGSTGTARSIETTGSAGICGILDSRATGIVAESAGEATEAGTHVAARVAADLLESSAECSVQDEGFVGAFTFDASGEVG
jgi:hypothetical protein